MKIINSKKSVVLSIIFTSNNVLYTLTNFYGDVIFWTSIGSRKSKGLKKSAFLTIALTNKIILNHATQLGYNYIHIKIKGFSKNKKVVIKSLKQSILKILSICDESSFPHNGCINPRNKRI